MQPQQPFGGPKQPLRPTTTQNPFLAQRPAAAPAASAMPAMQMAAPRPATGPMVGNPVMGNPVRPMATPAAPTPAPTPASVAPESTASENPFAGSASVAPANDSNFGEKESMVADSSNNTKGGNKTMLYVAVACGILALAGIAFGVFGMMKKPETRVETKIETAVDLMSAENIVAPYTKQVTPLNTIVDSGMSDIAKFMLAYRNYPFSSGYGYTDDGAVVVTYAALNAVYRSLFGEDLARADYYAESYPSATFSVTEDGVERFEIRYDSYVLPAGLTSLTRVKSAAYDGDNLLVTVYHSILSVCGYMDDVPEGYCINMEDVNSVDGIDAFIENHNTMIPTADLTFTKTDGKYVLSSIVVNQAEDAGGEDEAEDEAETSTDDLVPEGEGETDTLEETNDYGLPAEIEVE